MTTRAERRRADAKAAKQAASDLPSLRARLKSVKLPGTPPPLADRTRKAILAYIDSATTHGLPFAEVVNRLADGRVAATVYQVETEEARAKGQDPQAGAACASGCAFCCILSGEDGGTITAQEAVTLHGALAPLTGEPDGRDWHPKACPALHPETRQCRAYDARPALCRSFHSTDAAACEANVEGAGRDGARLEGAHATYLAAQGLAREALRGVCDAPTFSLSKVARGAVEGLDAETALMTALHDDAALIEERKRTGQAWRQARSAAQKRR